MGRKNSNKSFYHYILEKPDHKFEYYLTLYDLEKELSLSRFTLNTKLNNPDYKLRKHPNIKLTRCYIPVTQEYSRKLEIHELHELREALVNGC